MCLSCLPFSPITWYLPVRVWASVVEDMDGFVDTAQFMTQKRKLRRKMPFYLLLIHCVHLCAFTYVSDKRMMCNDNNSNTLELKKNSNFGWCYFMFPSKNMCYYASTIIFKYQFKTVWTKLVPVQDAEKEIKSSGWKPPSMSLGEWTGYVHMLRILHSTLVPQAFLIIRPHFLRSLPPLAAVITCLLVRQVLGYTQPLRKKL